MGDSVIPEWNSNSASIPEWYRAKRSVSRRDKGSRTRRCQQFVVGRRAAVSYRDDPDFKFASGLGSYALALENLRYTSAFTPAPDPTTALLLELGGPLDLSKLPSSIGLSSIQSMLKGDAVAPPHGVELLNPLPIPKFPNPPVSPYPPPPPRPRSFLARVLRLMAKRPPPPTESQTDNIELAAHLK